MTTPRWPAEGDVDGWDERNPCLYPGCTRKEEKGCLGYCGPHLPWPEAS